MKETGSLNDVSYSNIIVFIWYGHFQHKPCFPGFRLQFFKIIDMYLQGFVSRNRHKYKYKFVDKPLKCMFSI